jgi:glycosyltransferase involved in cell wall biosynthesis
MKILIFNLRDIKNPNVSGAEIFTHEIAKRWFISSNKVTLIASGFKGGKKREKVDEVEIIRLGNMYSVYWLAKKYYKKHLEGKYNVIIDEYTYRPFITPRFVKEPIIFLAHELAREKWFYETPFPLSYIGYHFLEPGWLKNYANIPTITVSNSTKQDLREIGFKKVYIAPEGINFKSLDKIPEKEKDPTLLFVGLLKKANLADHAIKAFRLISKEFPMAKLWIVGRGAQLKKLKKLAMGLNIAFFGYVSEEKKLELMSKAHVLLVPAVKEGWGLIVTEANACGTPAIGYNVHGLRDSIRNRETGLLTEINPRALAEATIAFFNDEELRQKLTENALEWSKSFSWDKTAEEFMDVMKGVINE